jgi:hypothetical protein
MVVLVAYVGLMACGSAEPESPLILGTAPDDLSLGPRTLSDAQTRALADVIASSGEPCGSIRRSYLRDLDTVGHTEAWDVRCADGSYEVMIRADGTPAAVRPCRPTRGFEDVPCERASGMRRPYVGRRPSSDPGGPLNPELGKLLEPMTAKENKND